MKIIGKIERAIRLLQVTAKAAELAGKEIELCYSGGKDSDVILELCKMAGIKFRAIYKATTLDPSYTIKHCRENNVEVVYPEKTFFQGIAEHGLPSRYTRWCCSQLKEYKILDVQILGIRRSESLKRKKIYKEPTLCRTYKKGEYVEQILPILDWSDNDVLEFINYRGLKLHPLYYRPDGTIDVKKRLGCIGCPLRSQKKRLAEFRLHPKFITAYLTALKKWWYKDRSKELKTKLLFSDYYELLAVQLFFKSAKFACLNKESMFPIDYKKALENYFNIKLS